MVRWAESSKRVRLTVHGMYGFGFGMFCVPRVCTHDQAMAIPGSESKCAVPGMITCGHMCNMDSFTDNRATLWLRQPW